VLGLLAVIGLMVALIGAHLWADYQLRSGRSALARYHNLEAYYQLRRSFQLSPHRAETVLLLARAARRTGKFEEADALLERYQRLRGADEALVLERLLLRADQGDIEAVHKFFRARVNEDDPATPLMLESLARGFLRTYRLMDAEACLKDLLRRDPDNTQALLLRGSIMELRQRFADALADYRRAVEIDPGHDEVRLRLTGVLLQLFEPGKAIPHLEYLEKRFPDDPEVLLRLAQAKDLLGDQEEAKRLLDRLLARNPDYAAALVERGKLARRASQLKEAEELLRRALAREPSDAVARHQLFLCLTSAGRKAEAREEQERLRQLEDDLKRLQRLITVDMQQNPRKAALHHEAGMIALRAGAYKDARRWFQSALSVDPEYRPTHRILAEYYERIGNPALAARHREKAGPRTADPPKDQKAP
jgi:tetratricopeptide (TPR) repeat protein